MIRNLLALITGILSSFLLAAIAGFIVLNLRVYPFYQFIYSFRIGDTKNLLDLAEKVLHIIIFLIFPIISFITSFIAALIATRREYLISIMTVIPLCIVFWIYSFPLSINSIFAVFTFLISSTVGAYISKALKSLSKVS